MLLRDSVSGQVVSLSGKEVNCTGAVGELIYGGGTAFTSASNPAAEVLDGTGVTAGSNTFGVTQSATDGTITVNRAGDYFIELNLHDVSCGAAVGNIQFDIQVNSAAIAGTDRMQLIRLALTTKGGFSMKKMVRLASGDIVRTIVTSASGNVVTVTEGSLLVRQIKDRVTLVNIG